MANPYIALQPLHMPRLKYILDQSIGLSQAKGILAIDGHDACGILTPVLKQC